MKVFHRIANTVAEHSHFNTTSMLLIFNIDPLTHALYFYIFLPTESAQTVHPVRPFAPRLWQRCGFLCTPASKWNNRLAPSLPVHPTPFTINFRPQHCRHCLFLLTVWMTFVRQIPQLCNPVETTRGAGIVPFRLLFFEKKNHTF